MSDNRSFLVAHIFYITAFRKLAKGGKTNWSGNLLPFALLVGYGTMLYLALYPQLDLVMRVAVFVYAQAITAMSLACLALRGQQPKQAFQPMMAGALLFVLSDSCLAVNKFLMPLPQASLLIMATYIGAQYLIVRGALSAEIER